MFKTNTTLNVLGTPIDILLNKFGNKEELCYSVY